jgi:hypothetical protein
MSQIRLIPEEDALFLTSFISAVPTPSPSTKLFSVIISIWLFSVLYVTNPAILLSDSAMNPGSFAALCSLPLDTIPGEPQCSRRRVFTASGVRVLDCSNIEFHRG